MAFLRRRYAATGAAACDDLFIAASPLYYLNAIFDEDNSAS
jgi:hypothetical protein